MEYVVGCTHLDDTGILAYRNQNSVEEMNRSILERWNNKITRDDYVYVLGDFAVRHVEHWQAALNGTKLLVKGNHDPVGIYRAGFADIVESKSLILFNDEPEEPDTVFLSHYPHASWPGKSRGCFHLHAHSHGKGSAVRARRTGSRIADVSIDGWPGWPVTLLEVISILKKGSEA